MASYRHTHIHTHTAKSIQQCLPLNLFCLESWFRNLNRNQPTKNKKQLKLFLLIWLLLSLCSQTCKAFESSFKVFSKLVDHRPTSVARQSPLSIIQWFGEGMKTLPIFVDYAFSRGVESRQCRHFSNHETWQIPLTPVIPKDWTQSLPLSTWRTAEQLWENYFPKHSGWWETLEEKQEKKQNED